MPWLKWVIGAKANLAKRPFFVRAERCEYTPHSCALVLALEIARRQVCRAQTYARLLLSQRDRVFRIPQKRQELALGLFPAMFLPGSCPKAPASSNAPELRGRDT